MTIPFFLKGCTKPTGIKCSNCHLGILLSVQTPKLETFKMNLMAFQLKQPVMPRETLKQEMWSEHL